MAERIDCLTPNPFIDGPGDYLVKTLRDKIKAVPQFKKLFGDAVDAYKRMDYGHRNLPALRIYNDRYTKETESWFIVGDLTLDVLLPANLRRDDLQAVQDVVSSALMQQFRRPTFFEEVCAVVPGLNELGKRFDIDKSLGFEWGDLEVPLTQITVNFKIDLRKWDEYLESDNREKDSPFERTLEDLERLIGSIDGLSDAEEVLVTIPGTDQNLEE